MRKDNKPFPAPPHHTDSLMDTYRKMRQIFDVCSEKVQEMEELMQECEKYLETRGDDE